MKELFRKLMPDSFIQRINDDKFFIIVEYIEGSKELADIFKKSESWSISTDGDNVTIEIKIKKEDVVNQFFDKNNPK